MDDDVVTVLIGATLVIEGGAWKVYQYDFQQRWDDLTGCAA